MLSSPLSPEEFQKLFPEFASFADPILLLPLKGGANNRVFFTTIHEKKYAIKEYFFHERDTRRRLHHEYSFLEYAWKHNIANIPEPLAKNEERHLGIYHFIEGSPATALDVNEQNIKEAIQFFQKLNKNKKDGIHLPLASESCFTLKEHLFLIEKRLEKLREIPNDTAIDKKAHAIIQTSLLPKWRQIYSSLIKKEDQALSLEEKCISPSDFGFHNILIANEKTFFIDFEYAGWDDPAKTICDFFLQPKIPVPLSFYSAVSQAFASTTSNPEKCLERANLLFPLFQIKWCLIMLNGFCQVGKIRRIFSQSEELKAKEDQLEKIHNTLNTMR